MKTIATIAILLVAAMAFAEPKLEQYCGTWYGKPAGPTPEQGPFMKVLIEKGKEAGTVALKMMTAYNGMAVTGASGTAKLDGDILKFTPEEELPQNLAKMQGDRFRLVGDKLIWGGGKIPILEFTKSAPDIEKQFATMKEQDLDASRAAALRASCQNNLKQLGLVCKMFANEAKGMKYPPLAAPPNHFRLLKEKVFPEYITDANILLCPARKNEAPVADPFTGDHYYYLGYAVHSDKEFEAFAEVYGQAVKDGKLGEDLTVAQGKGGGGGNKIYALREGIERFYITDINDPGSSAKAASELPVFIERPGGHKDVISVLFLDGHVEAIPYPGKFPATKTVIEGLERLSK